MVYLKNYLKSDLYKFLKSKIILAHFFIPIIGLIFVLLYFKISSLGVVEKSLTYFNLISIAFPIIISIVINLVYEQEEEAKGFQYFLSAPTKKYIPHISKLTLILILSLLSTFISILGFGIILNFIEVENISTIFYVKEAFIIFISNIALYILQYMIVFYFGKALSIGFGIIGSLIVALMRTGLGDGIWVILPWGYSIRLSSYFLKYEIIKEYKVMLQGEIKLAIISIITFIVIDVILLMIFTGYWEGKKAI